MKNTDRQGLNRRDILTGFSRPEGSVLGAISKQGDPLSSVQHRVLS